MNAVAPANTSATSSIEISDATVLSNPIQVAFGPHLRNAYEMSEVEVVREFIAGILGDSELDKFVDNARAGSLEILIELGVSRESEQDRLLAQFEEIRHETYQYLSHQIQAQVLERLQIEDVRALVQLRISNPGITNRLALFGVQASTLLFSEIASLCTELNQVHINIVQKVHNTFQV